MTIRAHLVFRISDKKAQIHTVSWLAKRNDRFTARLTENNRDDTATDWDEVDLLSRPSTRSVTVRQSFQEQVEVVVSQCSNNHGNVHDGDDIDQPVGKRASVKNQLPVPSNTGGGYRYLAAVQVIGFMSTRPSLSSRCIASSA